MKQKKAPVSERALVARINRILIKQHRTLRRCRDDSISFPSLGAYYIVNLQCNSVEEMSVSLEARGRKFGALKKWEKLC